MSMSIPECPKCRKGTIRVLKQRRKPSIRYPETYDALGNPIMQQEAREGYNRWECCECGETYREDIPLPG